jgi:hypothetical protein
MSRTGRNTSRETPGSCHSVAAWGAALAAAAAFAAAACTYSQSNVVKPGTLSPTLAPFLYKEEGALILMTVGVNATRFHENDPFVPLEVWIANKGVEPHIRINRESLFVTDTFGRRYGMAGVEEVRRLQSRSVLDRQITSAEFNAFKFSAYRLVESEFFPLLGASILLDRIEIPKYGYMRDILYFPHPEGDLLGGIFELHLTARELPEEVFVVFEVPR